MKVIKIIVLSLSILMVLSNNIFAIKEIFDTGKDFLGDGKANANMTMDTTELSDMSSKLYNILLGVATAVAIIVGAFLGIQFMTAGIDNKVEVKKSLFPYIISCVVIFASLGIWKLVVTILSKNVA